jgi:hypothetical protein
MNALRERVDNLPGNLQFHGFLLDDDELLCSHTVRVQREHIGLR